MKYTAEAFDQMQQLWEVKRFNDHQLRCVLRFNHRLDAESLRRAVDASVRAFPILGTRYIGGRRPHWTALETSDLGRAVVMARDETEFEEFVTSKVDESVGPQVRVCLLNSEPFSIALKMNHMICDAADFKAYLYFLCAAYTGVLPEAGCRPGELTNDRSVRRILKRFHLWTRTTSLFLQSNQNNHAGGCRFPLSGSHETRPFVLTRKLGRGTTATIKRYGKAKGATLNDVLLTAFYRCLFRRLNLSHGAMLRVPVMVDMRRYLPETNGAMPLSNLTSTVSTELNCKLGERFEDTLVRVKSVMDQRKRSNPGLNGFIKLDRAYRFLGRTMANRLLMAKMNHPLISMTNMGALDSDRMLFGGQRPCDAVFSGSIKYQPYFQLSVSSYDGELTLGVNVLGSNSDRDGILSFFDEMEAELPGRALVRLAAFKVYPDQKSTSRQYGTSHIPTDPQKEEVVAGGCRISNYDGGPMRLSALVSTYFVSALVLLFCGCSGVYVTPVSAVTGQIQGNVHGGQQPVTGATIQLYEAGTGGDGTAATPLLTSTVKTDSQGNFVITGLYTCPDSNPDVYITATGGNPGLSAGTDNAASAMMAALGLCSSLTSSSFIYVNEETTIASVNALAPYMTSYSALGSGSSDAPTMIAAFSSVSELVNATQGTVPGPSLPNGASVPVTTLNSLSDIIAACVNSAGGIAGDGSNCGNLFTAATPPSGHAPTDTVGAAIDIANNPTANIEALFNLIAADAAFRPVLLSPPATWAVLSQGFEVLSATPSSNGILTIPYSTNGSAAFAVATDNATGSAQQLTVGVSNGNQSIPITATICQTNSSTGQCLAQPTQSVQSSIANGATPTYSVFVTATAAISNHPVLFVTFIDGNGNLIASTGVILATD